LKEESEGEAEESTDVYGWRHGVAAAAAAADPSDYLHTVYPPTATAGIEDTAVAKGSGRGIEPLTLKS